MKKVIFRIPVAKFMGSSVYLNFFQETFGLPKSVTYTHLKKTFKARGKSDEFNAFIVCTAEEFGEFIVRRNQLNLGQNLIRNLEAVVYDPNIPNDVERAWLKVPKDPRDLFIHHTN